MSRYSSKRRDRVLGSPTSAVPAPPRTRPMPAHRFGLISRSSRRPRWSCCIRLCPTESMRAKVCCAIAIASSLTYWINSSAAVHAAALVSRTIICSRIPNLSVRPSSAAHSRDFLGGLRGRLAPRQVEIDVPGCDLDRRIRRSAETERTVRLALAIDEQPAAGDLQMACLEIDFLAIEQRLPDRPEFVGNFVPP